MKAAWSRVGVGMLVLAVCSGACSGGCSGDDEPSDAGPAPTGGAAAEEGGAGGRAGEGGTQAGSGGAASGGSSGAGSGGAGASGAGGDGDGGPGDASVDPGELIGGWTDLEMQPDALVIHVSNGGDDANPGTLSEPKATLQGAYEAVRDGEADWVLLERGGQWSQSAELQWAKTGPAADDAGWMRIGAYGDESSPRPRIDSGTATALVLTPGYRAMRPLTHIAVTDVHFVAQARIDMGAAAPAGAIGVQVLAVEYQGAGDAIHGVLLENLKIEGYEGGIITYEDAHDLRVRRCVLTEIFIPGGDGTRPAGILAAGVDLLFEENVFYRIQHPDMPGVTAISTQAHSAYIGAQAINVVSRGNIIVKTTEGFMQRAGGVFERNVSAFNEIAHLSGQAWGVTPTAGGITASVHDNLFLNAPRSLILGNTASGTVLRNLIVRGPEGGVSIGIDLVAENAQGEGVNIGVHDTRFERNVLSGDFGYDMNDATSFSGLIFIDNQTAQGAIDVSFADFMESIAISGDIDAYGRALIARDRASFTDQLRAETLINFYRAGLGVPFLEL